VASAISYDAPQDRQVTSEIFMEVPVLRTLGDNIDPQQVVDEKHTYEARAGAKISHKRFGAPFGRTYGVGFVHPSASKISGFAGARLPS
jgi:hypothetical protein